MHTAVQRNGGAILQQKCERVKPRQEWVSGMGDIPVDSRGVPHHTGRTIWWEEADCIVYPRQT
jgi:hypothetical protein